MNRKMFLIVVDAHLKLMEVEIVNSTTSQATTECLRMIFVRFGLPEMMVLTMEHATSSELQEFAQCNNIRYIHIAPYHPSSNGLVERAVQTFKLASGNNSLAHCRPNCHLFFSTHLIPQQV